MELFKGTRQMLCVLACVGGWVVVVVVVVVVCVCCGGGGVCVCAFVCERDDVPVYTCTGLHVGMLV